MSAGYWLLGVVFTVVNGCFVWWSMGNLNLTIAMCERWMDHDCEAECAAYHYPPCPQSHWELKA